MISKFENNGLMNTYDMNLTYSTVDLFGNMPLPDKSVSIDTIIGTGMSTGSQTVSRDTEFQIFISTKNVTNYQKPIYTKDCYLKFMLCSMHI